MKLLVAASAIGVCLVLASCGGAPPPAPGPVTVAPALGTPPPVTTTPVPIVKSKTVPSAGRPDPFVALFGPPTGAGRHPHPKLLSPLSPIFRRFRDSRARRVRADLGNGPPDRHLRTRQWLRGDPGRQWQIVLRAAGDSVDDQFRVIAIGPDYITLGTQTEERHFSLGG